MCGIAGFWGHSRSDISIGRDMAAKIKHRGPDDSGVWKDPNVGLVLAHQRLAILDLSQAGHQPMHSSCGRFVLIYNGEIYNHMDLRRDLGQQGYSIDWQGHSDTETLLAALSRWGMQKTLQKANGMFAFAFWDSEEKALFIGRDRMGEKPLYYGINGDTFLFGSELKSLSAHPDWRGEVDRDALSLYMRFKYVPTPWSIYQGISKLPPAHYISVRGNGRDISKPICYWNLGDVAEKGAASASNNFDELISEMNDLLRNAVAQRMAADVPLGAFLSGGYDSTMVAALMQSQSKVPIKTFTIGFYEEGYNEAIHAREVAEYLGTDHTELYVTSDQALAAIPKLPSIYDEPFSDSSQIPTYLVSQLAKSHVTVSLSGDGGDELFYGYTRYFMAENFWVKISRIPLSVRKLTAKVLSFVPIKPLENVALLFPKRYRIEHLSSRFQALKAILCLSSFTGFYRYLVSHNKDPARLVLGANEPSTILSEPHNLPQLASLSEKMMYLDMVTYLPDDILTKVDRASMAVSLEARVPLLDHRVVEFCWRVPQDFKFRDGQGKWLLRQLLYRYVPKSLVDRPKMGFGVPIEHWLRGPLREWAEELLDERRLLEEGFFDPAPIRKMWEEHLSGTKSRWHYYLWDVLMFQAWWESQSLAANEVKSTGNHKELI